MAETYMLVTGSRALYDTIRARAWADDAIEHAVDGLPPDAVVVCGDAAGPDTWAIEIADARGLRRREYALDGWIYEGTRRVSDLWATGDDRAWQRRDPPRWPLRRNLAMVATLAAVSRTLDEHGQPVATVRVLALIAGWSRTRGTEHTARLAERAGLPVTRLVCPAEYAPRARDGG